jgi:hypothetical protein
MAYGLIAISLCLLAALGLAGLFMSGRDGGSNHQDDDSP